MIEVEDDGGGIDIAKIKAKGVTLGLLRPESVSALSDAEAIKMIFLPGFSTADTVGDVAGRGVGMDVVKQTLERINGQIEVETELGVGTKFTLRLPLTLLISMALLVRAGSERYALPLPNIREVVMPAAGAVQEVGGHPVLQVGTKQLMSYCFRTSWALSPTQKWRPVLSSSFEPPPECRESPSMNCWAARKSSSRRSEH